MESPAGRMFPISTTLLLLAIVLVELVGYGVAEQVVSLWVVLSLGAFYLLYTSLIKRDVLPLIFATLFFTAYHSLFLNINTNNFPIALLFLLIFAVNSIIMWFLLHYATHLKKEHHIAYSVIAGFLIAQIITLFSTMAKDWPFRLELAAYMPTVFSYIFWRFACFSADSMLGWKQFIRMAALVIILVMAIILGSPNSPV